jgi:hypothetical protein
MGLGMMGLAGLMTPPSDAQAASALARRLDQFKGNVNL